jgi:hypothetical protein
MGQGGCETVDTRRAWQEHDCIGCSLYMKRTEAIQEKMHNNSTNRLRQNIKNH